MTTTITANAANFDNNFAPSDIWDFNDLIWQDTSALHPLPPEFISREMHRDTNMPNVVLSSPNSNHDLTAVNQASPASSTDAGRALVGNFLESVAPPILAAVEFGPRWTSTKMLFASLANSSDMVRYAIMAFSALQIGDEDMNVWRKHKWYYDKAAKCYAAVMTDAHQRNAAMSVDLQFPLATCFFLAYIALLTSRTEEAQSFLEDAASLVRYTEGRRFTLREKRIFSWIRLVDARACLTGGDGAFLSETDSEAYSSDTHPKESLQMDADIQILEADTDQVLFDVLHNPGLIFYQRVQSIMARVSNIDPWHRSRGTVADETEVMVIAEQIRKDLITLETQRPALTDHAVLGCLSNTHLGMSIATAITHSYRLYWANYQAAFIHVHRVAHKHLPAPAEVLRARSTIKKIARSFDEEVKPFPVNFIWPLLMACCEEDNLDDRGWMIAAIRSMQSGASNARPIADVLEEVHRRQDSSGQRADVRQTSMDLFNMSFAVF